MNTIHWLTSKNGRIIPMQRLVAKGLQFIGFVFVTTALVVGLMEADALAREIQLLFVGSAVFFTGRYLEPGGD